jgi:hypothetical protein
MRTMFLTLWNIMPKRESGNNKKADALCFPALRPHGGEGPRRNAFADGTWARLRPGIHASLIDYKNRVIKLFILPLKTGRGLFMDLQLANKLALVTGSTAGGVVRSIL